MLKVLPVIPRLMYIRQGKGSLTALMLACYEVRKQNNLAAREMLPLDDEQEGHSQSFTNSEISQDFMNKIFIDSS